jgi:hypothetical protein
MYQFITKLCYLHLKVLGIIILIHTQGPDYGSTNFVISSHGILFQNLFQVFQNTNVQLGSAFFKNLELYIVLGSVRILPLYIL